MKLLIVAGTRPEIIKCARVYLAAKNSKDIQVAFCNTGQHKEMAQQSFEIFNIKPEMNLNIMKENQTLNDISKALYDKLPDTIYDYNPDYVLLQGDTSTAVISALISFNMKYKVAHLEAGLRTFNLEEPFPEEANRKLISAIANVHLCPTKNNSNNLKKEGVTKNVFVVGNTVVDALKYIDKNNNLALPNNLKSMMKNNKYILLTSHRRESFGEGLKNICDAIISIAIKYSNIDIIYPVHLNPNVKNVVNKYLKGYDNIILIEPVDYITMLSLIKNSIFCVSDSGGIQEEAPSFNKYCIVLRNYTERIESINSGISFLAGTNKDKIVNFVSQMIDNELYKMDIKKNPYGNGKASELSLNVLRKLYQ